MISCQIYDNLTMYQFSSRHRLDKLHIYIKALIQKNTSYSAIYRAETGCMKSYGKDMNHMTVVPSVFLRYEHFILFFLPYFSVRERLKRLPRYKYFMVRGYIDISMNLLSIG